MAKELIQTFQKIEIEKPVDKIIQQIRNLISSGQLKPGDKLPSERKLSEQFAVGRTYVRDAIRKLEFYGILKTLPQSGTVVAGFGISALEGLIGNVLELEQNEFSHLVETRVVLETNAARFAALRRDEHDLEEMRKALRVYEKAYHSGEETVEADLMFHLKIAEASKNTVLKSLMLIVTPDILTYFKEREVCSGDEPGRALEYHYELLDYITRQDADAAEEAMHNHLKHLLTIS